MNDLRIAVIGAGRLGGFHADKLATLPGVNLVAVADPVEAARQAVAQKCRTRAVADPRELLGQIDAAVVAAPTAGHHALGRMLLEAGVHVLMEKPLCSTAAQAQELVDLAHRQGLVLQVGHVERFNPAFSAAQPKLGAPKYLDAVRASGFTFRSMDVGVVLDLMIHDLDLVLTLVQAPLRRVEALGLSVLGGHEDVANARLEFADGCVATLSASRVSYEAARRMHVWSLDGFASIDFATRSATLVEPSAELLRQDFDAATLPAEKVARYRDHLFEDLLPKSQFACDAVDALRLENEDFVASIRGQRPPRVTGEHGCAAIRVAEAILAEIERHAWSDRADGPAGPHAVPPQIIPAPHFDRSTVTPPWPRRAAG